MKTRRLRLVLALAAVSGMALVGGCATAVHPYGATPPSTPPGDQLLNAHLAMTAEPIAQRVDLAARPAIAESAIDARILALDPEHVTDEDVRTTLAAAPTPRIILAHGGVAGVYLIMESFARFLVGMGYPEDRIRDPHDGAYSQNPYGSSERLAGEIAWYYEHDGVRPMMIGHSQGGMQTSKVLHELAGEYGQRIRVWNPVLDRPERRYEIVDPLTHTQRPVVGVSLSFASSVGAGGLEFLAPAEWSLIGRLRSVPDSVDEFTGFSIAGDMVALTPLTGASDGEMYRQTGHALVRNVNLPLTYNHVFVPSTEHLLEDPKMRAWIDAYSPDRRPDSSTLPDGPSTNALWAANVWYGIKKHWVIEAQELIRAREGDNAAARRQSAQR